MKHWHRGLSIAEHWRLGFHRLVSQVLEDDMSSYSDNEQKALDALRKLGPGGHTAREISQVGTALRMIGVPKLRGILTRTRGYQCHHSDGQGKNALYSLKGDATC